MNELLRYDTVARTVALALERCPLVLKYYDRRESAR